MMKSYDSIKAAIDPELKDEAIINLLLSLRAEVKILCIQQVALVNMLIGDNIIPGEKKTLLEMMNLMETKTREQQLELTAWLLTNYSPKDEPKTRQPK